MGRFISEDTRQYIRLLGQITTLGLTMVFATMIGFGLGYLVDSHWPDLSPWGKAGGFLIGVVAGYRNFFRVVTRFSLKNRKPQAKNDPPKSIH